MQGKTALTRIRGNQMKLSVTARILIIGERFARHDADRIAVGRRLGAGARADIRGPAGAGFDHDRLPPAPGTPPPRGPRERAPGAPGPPPPTRPFPARRESPGPPPGPAPATTAKQAARQHRRLIRASSRRALELCRHRAAASPR